MKRIVLAFGGEGLKVDPKFCDHKNASITSNEVDGKLYHCPDCNATLDEDFEIVQVISDDDIPF